MSQQTRVLEAQNRDLAAAGAKLELRAQEAAVAYQKAQAEVAEQQRKLDSAETSYALEPSEKTARARAAQAEALELAKIRARKPLADQEAAAAALGDWRARKTAVDAELAAAREAERLEALQERASVAAFDAATATPAEKLKRALRAAQEAAAEIDAAFAAANAAAGELTAAGVPTAPLAPFHLVKPLMRWCVAARPALAGGLLESYAQISWNCRTSGAFLGGEDSYSLAAVVTASPLLGAIGSDKRGLTAPEHVPAALARLEATFACRTENDVATAREARARAETDAAAHVLAAQAQHEASVRAAEAAAEARERSVWDSLAMPVKRALDFFSPEKAEASPAAE